MFIINRMPWQIKHMLLAAVNHCPQPQSQNLTATVSWPHRLPVALTH
jgi:hypothetical protein